MWDDTQSRSLLHPWVEPLQIKKKVIIPTKSIIFQIQQHRQWTNEKRDCASQLLPSIFTLHLKLCSQEKLRTVELRACMLKEGGGMR